jgi:hypothetical protein
MLRVLICKGEVTSSLRKSREVLEQYTLNLARIFVAFATTFLDQHETSLLYTKLPCSGRSFLAVEET